MSIDRVNGWLTLVANIGVLVGIFFLAFELQQNTNISRSAEYRENVQEINSWRALLVSDAELTDVFSTYIEGNFDELNNNQRSRLRQLLQTLFGIYDNAYFSYQLGIMGESEFARFEAGACDHLLRSNENEDLDLARWLTADFENHLRLNCK